MESCQDQTLHEEKMDAIENAIMDWTAVFVRLWMHDINQFTRTSGLSFGQMNLLLHIHYRGPCEVTSVSDLMQMTPPGASQMVERMVQQGLVTRCEVAGDRRVRLVHLTEQGLKLVLESINVHREWVHSLAANLTPEQQAESSHVLNMLTGQSAKLKLGS
jgi:DNA-binding MarR family transcriptional regulator